MNIKLKIKELKLNSLKKIFIKCFFYFLLTASLLPVLCQENNPIEIYDNLIKPQNASEQNEPVIAPAAPPPIEEKLDELTLLLPNIDSPLFANWSKVDKPLIWTEGNPTPDFLQQNADLLRELKLEKVLKQTYMKENHVVDAFIYKFRDFAGAYSAYSVLHSGATTKLKVGKSASESDSLINFWKDIYYIDIHTNTENDNISKEFIVLASQDISNNIKTDQMPPVVVIQLPALNRVQGTEKYCLGITCCNKYFKKEEVDFSLFNIPESGGIITAEYQSGDSKDKERISLVLARYLTKENAQAVFFTIKEYFEKKKLTNKEIDIDFEVDDSILQIKNKKNNYTMLKQKGNLLAIAYDITNKKSGQQILSLIPWPIEITKPINTITNTESDQETNKEGN